MLTISTNSFLPDTIWSLYTLCATINKFIATRSAIRTPSIGQSDFAHSHSHVCDVRKECWDIALHDKQINCKKIRISAIRTLSICQSEICETDFAHSHVCDVRKEPWDIVHHDKQVNCNKKCDTHSIYRPKWDLRNWFRTLAHVRCA